MLKAEILISDGYTNMVSARMAIDIKPERLSLDREGVSAALSSNLARACKAIEENEIISPVPQDQPCCGSFEDWARALPSNSTAVCCPFCAKKISVDRKQYFFKG